MTGLYLPGAVWRPVSYRGQSGLFAPGHPVGYIPHVQVGNGSLWGVFEYAPDGNRRFSNAWVAKSGASEQYTELNCIPWAQVNGNPDYLAFECEGYPGEPYTAAQINTLATWHNALGMPDLITDTPGAPGVGTHCMGGAAYGGHSCPGPGLRAGQRSAIIARAQVLRGLKPVPPTPPPAGKANTMTVIQAPNGAIYMSDGFQKRHILGMPEVQGWLKALHQADAESVPQVVIDNLAGAK